MHTSSCSCVSSHFECSVMHVLIHHCPFIMWTQENLRQLVLQDIVRLVLNSDIDRDGIISKSEAKLLEFKITVSLKIYGITFDKEKFQRAIGLSPSLCGVMTIVKRLLPDKNNRLSSFYSVVSDYSSSDEEGSSSFGYDEGEDDDYDMFYIDVEEQSNRGDVDTLSICKDYFQKKGRRPKLMSLSPSARRGFRRVNFRF